MVVPSVSLPKDNLVITALLSIPDLALPVLMLCFSSSSHIQMVPVSVPLCSGCRELTISGSPLVRPPPVIANQSSSLDGCSVYAWAAQPSFAVPSE